MDEVWKVIEEAPNCLVSNLGNVKVSQRTIVTSTGHSVTYKEHDIAKNKKRTGYLEVALPVDKNKRIYRLVHRLVLSAFAPVEDMDNLEVNHKDENKENNCLENLEWVTSQENCNYGNRNQKISNKIYKVKVKCITTGKIYDSLAAAAEDTGCIKSSICNCCKGKRNHTHNLKWEYYYD